MSTATTSRLTVPSGIGSRNLARAVTEAADLAHAQHSRFASLAAAVTSGTLMTTLTLRYHVDPREARRVLAATAAGFTATSRALIDLSDAYQHNATDLGIILDLINEQGGVHQRGPVDSIQIGG